MPGRPREVREEARHPDGHALVCADDAQKKWVIEGEGKWEKKVWYGAKRFFEWLETKAYKMHVRVLLSRYRAYTPCTTCGGSRLKPDALLWKIEGRNVLDLMLLSLDKSRAFFETLRLPAPLDEAADLLLREVRARFAYLCEVGLGYLTLDRQSRTLSGGEVQRINLTTALGTSLVNTLFVLDEPSIGLHPRDMQRVTQVMHRLRDAGNSLVVVEHDPQIMLAADRMLDMGPGAGERGGEIVAFDTPAAIRANPRSLTGQYLSGAKNVAPRAVPPPKVENEPLKARMVPSQKAIKLRGVTQHNLKNVDVEFPLRRLVCITGVSGSGKSTLIEDVLYKALRKALGQPSEMPGEFDRLDGAELVDDVVMIDQSSIGRTTRSNPASYVGAFDVVRELFANEATAKCARLHRRHVLVQLRHRTLPDLQRQRLRARGDAVPERRVPALPGLRRQTISRGDARDPARRRGRHAAQHRGRARHDGHRGARRSSRTSPRCTRGCSRWWMWAWST